MISDHAIIIHTRENTFLRTTHTLFAIDKDRNYIVLDERDLEICSQNNKNYVCKTRTMYIKAEVPCEVQVYIKLLEKI